MRERCSSFGKNSEELITAAGQELQVLPGEFAAVFGLVKSPLKSFHVLSCRLVASHGFYLWLRGDLPVT